VEAARRARLKILEHMASTLPAPRAELSKYAPRIEVVKINPEKIGALIGPGGKNIKRIVEESGCEINIEDDGTVNIYSTSGEGMKIAKDAITGMTAEAEIGKTYRAKVVSIKEFGCFVEFLPGREGLVHISELANFRVKQTEDIVKMGDEIWVKCVGIDEKGKVRLSRKAAMAERDAEMGSKEGGSPSDGGSPEGAEGAPAPEGQERYGRPDRQGGGDRGPRPDRPERRERRGGGGGGSGGGGGGHRQGGHREQRDR
jgi:polyribonucleotide nucleotidyltransferase